MEIDNNILICPYCGQLTKVVWVHGHGQCMFCKTNFDECCRGENMDDGNNNNEEPLAGDSKEIKFEDKKNQDEKI